MEENPIIELAKKTNRSRGVIYKLARRFNRLPTEEEVLNRKNGRPRKTRYQKIEK